MPWTEITRAQYERDSARYASDLTDGEWALIEPFVPEPNRIGRPRPDEDRRVEGRGHQALRPRQRLRGVAAPMGG